MTDTRRAENPSADGATVAKRSLREYHRGRLPDRLKRLPEYLIKAASVDGPDDVGYWLTPPDLMARLDAEFHFDFDPCPFPHPQGFDGLTVEWGKASYVNPPYRGGFARWVDKAIEEQRKGKTVVFIAPVDDWQDRLLSAMTEYRSLGHLEWRDPRGRKAPHRGRADSLFVLRPKAESVARGARDSSSPPP